MIIKYFFTRNYNYKIYSIVYKWQKELDEEIVDEEILGREFLGREFLGSV